MSHVTRTPLSRSKGQRSKSPGHFTQRGLNAWGRCSGDRENYWAWETTATLRLLDGVRGVGAPTGEERGGSISCRHANSLFTYACIKCQVVT